MLLFDFYSKKQYQNPLKRINKNDCNSL